MRGKCRTHHIAEVVILLIWMSSCSIINPEGTQTLNLGIDISLVRS